METPTCLAFFLLLFSSVLISLVNNVSSEFPAYKSSSCPKRGNKGLGEHCCSDSECLTTICQRHSCVCLREGEACGGRDEECCGNFCDSITLKCICKDAAERCSVDTECCGGRCVKSGRCCKPIGLGCKEDDECCSQVCRPGFLGQLKCNRSDHRE